MVASDYDYDTSPLYTRAPLPLALFQKRSKKRRKKDKNEELKQHQKKELILPKELLSKIMLGLFQVLNFRV